ncbi:hypothetical protein BGZ81_002100 [Podila clonocystis]|nr:hypothetical protein BGZ81_002100 [Podila clonocystis]
MVSITLFCLQNGEAASRVFSVEMDPAKTVDHLKDLIKAKKAPRFDDIAADELTLWRVSIPIADDVEELPILLDNVTGEDKKKLGPAMRLSNVFSKDFPEETIHVMVQRPPRAVDLTADTKFLVSVKGKNPEPWEWDVSPSTATLEDFRQHIYVKCCIREDERRGIVIEHAKSPLFRDGGVDRPLGDSKLRAILRMYVGAGLRHIDVHLEFLPKGFSKFSLAEVHERLSTDDFKPFELGTIPCNTEERKAVLEEMKGAINLARRAHLFKSEACVTRYVAPYIQAAVALNQELCLTPEQEISGRWGSGDLDYGIESRHATEYVVGAVEVKKEETFIAAFQQNAMQLDAVLTTRDTRCSRNEPKPLISYGIITDAKRWEFLECRLEPMEATDIIQGPPIIRKTALPVIVNYDKENWADDAQKVFEYILWFAELMSQGLPSTKRVKGNDSLTREP